MRKLRYDGWQNSLTLLGTSSDKTASTKYGAQKAVTLDQLRLLHDGDWLAERIVSLLPDQALRKGFETDEESAHERFLEINHDSRHPSGVLQFALRISRLEAGAALLLGTKSRAPLDRPLPEGAELEWLDVVRRDQLTAVEREIDPMLATYNQPTKYRISGDHTRAGTVWHATRLLWCEGREIANLDYSNWISDLVTEKGMPQWGSVLQPVYDTIARYGISWAAVANMLQEASIAVFKMEGLIDMLTSENQDDIEARFLLLNQSRSVAKTIALDASGNESYERTAVSLADLPQTLQQITNDVAGAANIPSTILFGMSPGGLNATGESDLTQWYDRVEQYRTVSVTPKLKRLLSLCGAREPEIAYPALWEPTEKEVEERRSKVATRDQVYWNLGAFSDAEIRRLRGEEMLGLTPAEAAKPLDQNAPIPPPEEETIPPPEEETSPPEEEETSPPEEEETSQPEEETSPPEEEESGA